MRILISKTKQLNNAFTCLNESGFSLSIQYQINDILKMFLYERTYRTGTMANSNLLEKTMRRKMLQQSSQLNGNFEDTLTLYKM